MGDAIQYQVVVKNTGNVTLHNVTLSDTLTALSCTPAAPVASLAPNATITCTGTYLVTQGDLDAGTVNNTATADSDETAPSSDSETATASKTPTLSIDKTITSGGSDSQVGDAIQYQVVVKNTGNVTLQRDLERHAHGLELHAGRAGGQPGAQRDDHLHGHIPGNARGSGCRDGQ